MKLPAVSLLLITLLSLLQTGCTDDRPRPGVGTGSVRDTLDPSVNDTPGPDTIRAASTHVDTSLIDTLSADSLARIAAAERAERARASTACGWITEAEASRALGQPSVYGKSDDGGVSCIIEPAEPTEGTTLSVDLRVEENGTYRFDYYASMKGIRPVANLGDRAAWMAGDMTGTLLVAKGPNTLMVTLSGTRSGPAMRAKAIALAGVIVERM